MTVRVSLVRSLSEVAREEWDALVGPDGSPFLEWDWLRALEETGCACPERGWAPCHVVVRRGRELVAAAPAYVKGNSQGEFVFDHAWAAAAEEAGIRYYPKLLVGVPFTPVSGHRLLTAPGEDRDTLVRVLARALHGIRSRMELSSVHVNFCTAEEAAVLQEEGFTRREGIQYHWYNRGFRTFDDYLNSLRSHRRNQIRRERRQVAAAGVRVEVRQGTELPREAFGLLYRLYVSTVDRYIWGRRYLTPAFFEALGERYRHRLVVLLARAGKELVGGTINVEKADVLYGRYWGCFREIRHLHFETCYYAAIEYAAQRGIRRFEPGAGGEFKYARGFEAAVTHSAHALAHPGLAQAVARFAARERAAVQAAVAELQRRGPLKPPSG